MVAVQKAFNLANSSFSFYYLKAIVSLFFPFEILYRLVGLELDVVLLNKSICETDSQGSVILSARDCFKITRSY